MRPSANRRRFMATKPRKLLVSSPMPALPASIVITLAWSSREITGERIARLRSSLLSIIARRTARSLATASNCLPSSANSNKAAA